MKPHVFLFALLSLLLRFGSSAQAQFPMMSSPTQTNRNAGGAASRSALPGTVGDQSPKGTAKITGSVIDSTQAKAVEFASIALYNIATGKAVDGTVADDKGKFTLSKLVAGQYRVLVSFVGYQNKTIDNLILSNGQSLDLGVIQLASSVKTLAEVTVTGQAALIEEKVDRLVYNADKDITAKGGDAADVLRKVPLLTVDLDGNVSIRGSQNIRVLINNKPSTIVASSVSDALKQIPADQIKSVEVITSPSAKYDAEGSGGIINIITKKNTLQGLNLNLDSGMGNRGSMLMLNGNYRRKNFGVTLGGFGRANYNTILKTSLDQTSQVNGVSTLTRQTGNGNSSGLFGQYNLGFDYDIDDKQSLTAGVRYGVRNMLSQQDLTTQLFTDGVAGTLAKRNVDVKNLSGTIDANVDYLHTFKPGQEWSISTLYSRNDLTNNFDSNLFGSTDALTGRLRNVNNNVNQEFTFQTDYQTPIQKNQMLEFGGKAIFRTVNSDYTYLTAGPTGGFSLENNGTSGSLLYHQNIAAAYTSYTYTTRNRYSLKEDYATNRRLSMLVQMGEKNLGVGNYGVLVPSLNASKTIKGTTVRLGYNRRIQRPGLAQLNPNLNASNPQNITQGNPQLLPELTNNFELGLSKTINKTFVNATFFGRTTNNAITQVSRPSDSLRGAIVTTFENIGHQQAYGVNLFSNVALTSKINVGLFVNSFYTRQTGQAMGTDGLSTAMTNSGFTIGGGTSVSAQLGSGWGIQGFGFMQGNQIQLQGTQGGFGFYSLGARKDLPTRKGVLAWRPKTF